MAEANISQHGNRLPARTLKPLSNQNKEMNTIAIASMDSFEDMTRDKRLVKRQMRGLPRHASVETEVNFGKSDARTGDIPGFAWAKNYTLCPVALGSFMQTSNAYLLSSASDD
jgi:hypothetical protein